MWAIPPRFAEVVQPIYSKVLYLSSSRRGFLGEVVYAELRQRALSGVFLGMFSESQHKQVMVADVDGGPIS
jgi:hypothetical protein